MRQILPFVAGLACCATVASAQVLWSNQLRGPGTPNDFGLNPVTQTNAGGPVNPPVQFWSECQTQGAVAPAPPEQWYASNVAGHGIQLEGATSNAAADDFTVSGGTWKVDAFEFAAYETSAPVSVSSIISVVVQVWNGRPGDTGSTVVWGDLTTNRLAGPPAATGAFRIFCTSINACGVAPGSSVGVGRSIYRVRADTTGLSLPPGTYWVEWQMTGGSFAGPWAVPVTRQYERNGCQPFGTCNSRQRITATWQDMQDSGQPRGPASPFGQTCGTYTGVEPIPALADMAFLVYGTINATCPGTGAGACSRADWNEDGVIDFNDFLGFLNDFNAQNDCADLNGDQVVDFNDFLEFLNIYNAGC